MSTRGFRKFRKTYDDPQDSRFNEAKKKTPRHRPMREAKAEYAKVPDKPAVTWFRDDDA